jgi:hypothetical protein
MQTNNENENTVETAEEVHDILEKDTETKEASQTQSKLWSFGEEVEEATIVNNSDQEKTSSASSEKKQVQPQTKEKAQLDKISAESAVATIDVMLSLVGSLILSVKCKNKFAGDEFDKGKAIRDFSPNDLNEADRILQAKFIRETEKRAEKIKELDFTPTEIERLNLIFENYFRVTGKQFSPEWMLVSGLGSIVIDRAAIIFMD